MQAESNGECRYAIDQDLGLALVRIAGDVTAGDIVRCANALQSEPSWSHDFAAIWDERGLTALEVTLEGMDAMVEAQATGEVGPDIIITDQEDYEIVMRLYAWRVRVRGRPAKVVTTLEEALGCLGLEELPASVRGLAFQEPA